MKNEITIDGVVYVRKEEEVSPTVEPKPWPQVGDTCFCLSDNGVVFVTPYAPTYQSDVDRLSMGSYFKTKEEAEKVKAERIAITTIKNYARQQWGEFKPDWKESGQYKYVVYYSHDCDKFYANYDIRSQYFSPIGHFREKAHAEEIIKKFPEELEVIRKFYT